MACNLFLGKKIQLYFFFQFSEKKIQIFLKSSEWVSAYFSIKVPTLHSQTYLSQKSRKFLTFSSLCFKCHHHQAQLKLFFRFTFWAQNDRSDDYCYESGSWFIPDCKKSILFFTFFFASILTLQKMKVSTLVHKKTGKKYIWKFCSFLLLWATQIWVPTPPPYGWTETRYEQMHRWFF